MSSTASLGSEKRPAAFSIWVQAIRPATLPAAVQSSQLPPRLTLPTAHGTHSPGLSHDSCGHSVPGRHTDALQNVRFAITTFGAMHSWHTPNGE